MVAETAIVAAGVRLTCNRALAMAGDRIEADCDCAIELGGAPPEGGEWQAVISPSIGTRAFLRSDGRSAVIPDIASSDEAVAAQVRMIAPLAAALQGRVTLHAACVSRAGMATAFIGESGAGKSTFARHMAALGWGMVCDDLLPVRRHGGKWIIRSLAGGLGLESVYFLARGGPCDDLRLTALPARDAMLAHLRDGFGELGDRAVWGHQFVAYATLARDVASHHLTVPHDLARLPSLVADFARQVGAGGAG